jgi:hypothetical protein
MKYVLFICFLSIFFFVSCQSESAKFRKYTKELEIVFDRPALVINLDNCSSCYSVFFQSVKRFELKNYIIVIIAKESKKANLLSNSKNANVFHDVKNLAMNYKILESLPRIYLTDGTVIEVISPEIIDKFIDEN